VAIHRPQGLTLLFPNIEEGLNGIFLPACEQLENFLVELQKVIKVLPYEDTLKVPVFKEIIEYNCANIQEVPLEGGNSAYKYIEKAGGAIKHSFSWLGGVIAHGFHKGGEFISRKKPEEEEEEEEEEETQEQT